ncbi:hypothetical protein ZIOFF_074430 (mitochondrion) [Zingiber officinale]|uniref:Uncharacterized protein n=1 Tax=Zingiber officinale TaxID=94328 RepID=A0A8J5BWU6_ZINOF|nr:hypothetical protein ZIOFF_074430 [Zingiber officinale]
MARPSRESSIQAIQTTFAKDRVFEVVESLGPGPVSLYSPFFHRIERPKTPHLRRRRKKMTLNTTPEKLQKERMIGIAAAPLEDRPTHRESFGRDSYPPEDTTRSPLREGERRRRDFFLVVQWEPAMVVVLARYGKVRAERRGEVLALLLICTRTKTRSFSFRKKVLEPARSIVERVPKCMAYLISLAFKRAYLAQPQDPSAVLHEEDFVQHVLFDTGRRRTRLGIVKKRGEAEPSQDDMDHPKDLTISEGLFNFHSEVPMSFHTRDLEKLNGQIAFLRNTYKKKDKVRVTYLATLRKAEFGSQTKQPDERRLTARVVLVQYLSQDSVARLDSFRQITKHMGVLGSECDSPHLIIAKVSRASSHCSTISASSSISFIQSYSFWLSVPMPLVLFVRPLHWNSRGLVWILALSRHVWLKWYCTVPLGESPSLEDLFRPPICATSWKRTKFNSHIYMYGILWRMWDLGEEWGIGTTPPCLVPRSEMPTPLEFKGEDCRPAWTYQVQVGHGYWIIRPFHVSKENSILDLIDRFRILWKAVFDESRMYGGDLSYLSRSTRPLFHAHLTSRIRISIDTRIHTSRSEKNRTSLYRKKALAWGKEVRSSISCIRGTIFNLDSDGKGERALDREGVEHLMKRAIRLLRGEKEHPSEQHLVRGLTGDLLHSIYLLGAKVLSARPGFETLIVKDSNWTTKMDGDSGFPVRASLFSAGDASGIHSSFASCLERSRLAWDRAGG